MIFVLMLQKKTVLFFGNYTYIEESYSVLCTQVFKRGVLLIDSL